MGADIHWVAERLHSDGKWEAVFSESSCRQPAGKSWWNDQVFCATPQERFGDRDYRWFGLLSNVRGHPIDDLGDIATAGLPHDVSKYAQGEVGDDDDLHSQGWFTVKMLKEARAFVEKSQSPSRKDDLETLDYYLGLIEQMKDASRDTYPIDLENILFGESYDPEGGTYMPDMLTESNHARLARIKRAEGLLPISDETLRFCIAYDS